MRRASRSTLRPGRSSCGRCVAMGHTPTLLLDVSFVSCWLNGCVNRATQCYFAFCGDYLLQRISRCLGISFDTEARHPQHDRTKGTGVSIAVRWPDSNRRDVNGHVCSAEPTPRMFSVRTRRSMASDGAGLSSVACRWSRPIHCRQPRSPSRC